jgi:hypothetical protein
LNFSHSTREKQQKDRRKSTAADVARTKRILDPFFFPVYFFFYFALDYSTHRPPNGIHTHTDELYSERPATEMQPSALYIICLSALKNIFIDYFTLWRSDWAPAAGVALFPFRVRTKTFGSYKDQNPLTALLDTK